MVYSYLISFYLHIFYLSWRDKNICVVNYWLINQFLFLFLISLVIYCIYWIDFMHLADTFKLIYRVLCRTSVLWFLFLWCINWICLYILTKSHWILLCYIVLWTYILIINFWYWISSRMLFQRHLSIIRAGKSFWCIWRCWGKSLCRWFYTEFLIFIDSRNTCVNILKKWEKFKSFFRFIRLR